MIAEKPKTDKSMERSSKAVWLDCLRASVTVLVVAHHSSLAYTNFARFDPGRYLASTAPIVDTVRWGFFDYAENFNDVFFMSLMFFLSGLLVLPGVARHGKIGYLRGRAKRLGLVFLLAVGLLMPLAYYPSYLQAGGSMSYLAYWFREFPKDGLPPGPPWFLWMLLLFDSIAVASLPALKSICAHAAKLFESWEGKPGKAFLTIFLTPPLYFQTSRMLPYFAWFAFGALMGAKGPDHGLVSRQGKLARRWPAWIAAWFMRYCGC